MSNQKKHIPFPHAIKEDRKNMMLDKLQEQLPHIYLSLVNLTDPMYLHKKNMLGVNDKQPNEDITQELWQYKDAYQSGDFINDESTDFGEILGASSPPPENSALNEIKSHETDGFGDILT